MAEIKSALPWRLKCPWCDWFIIVGGRGMRGNDPGAGVEAARVMEEHVAHLHGKTWAEFLGEERNG